jgi:hypothetical protein
MTITDNFRNMSIKTSLTNTDVTVETTLEIKALTLVRPSYTGYVICWSKQQPIFSITGSSSDSNIIV